MTVVELDTETTVGHFHRRWPDQQYDRRINGWDWGAASIGSGSPDSACQWPLEVSKARRATFAAIETDKLVSGLSRSATQRTVLRQVTQTEIVAPK
jgi:hypothetical protein